MARPIREPSALSVYRPGLFNGKVVRSLPPFLSSLVTKRSCVRHLPHSFAIIKTQAIVTGGGTGIGKSIAHELALLGCTVVIAARWVAFAVAGDVLEIGRAGTGLELEH